MCRVPLSALPHGNTDRLFDNPSLLTASHEGLFPVQEHQVQEGRLLKHQQRLQQARARGHCTALRAIDLQRARAQGRFAAQPTLTGPASA